MRQQTAAPRAFRPAFGGPLLTTPAPDAGFGLLTLTPAEFQSISKLAYEKFGLNLKSGKEGLVAARLAKVLRKRGITKFADYYRQVLGDASGESLIELIDLLTTNYTSFMRERAHFDFLAKMVSTELRDASGLRIWSAACSTGEEPYTIAMCLTDAARATRCRWENNVRITATDISSRVLARARKGVYEEARFEGLPEQWWKSYVQRAGGEHPGAYQLKPELTRLVQFDRLNLVEPFPSQLYHVIFCRNVMIYFDRATQEAIVTRLARCLEPDGYLIVGHSETLTGFQQNLTYVQPAVYKAPRGAARRGQNQPVAPRQDDRHCAPIPPRTRT